MPQKKKSKSALAVRDLTVSYGSNRVVDDVSFRVPQGTVMGLIGPNGAGKSTIIKSVIDLIPLEHGDIRFFGEPLSHSRHRVAYMPQAADVDWDYPITVEQVVANGLVPQAGLVSPHVGRGETPGGRQFGVCWRPPGVSRSRS